MLAIAGCCTHSFKNTSCTFVQFPIHRTATSYMCTCTYMTRMVQIIIYIPFSPSLHIKKGNWMWECHAKIANNLIHLYTYNLQNKDSIHVVYTLVQYNTLDGIALQLLANVQYQIYLHGKISHQFDSHCVLFQLVFLLANISPMGTQGMAS